MQVSDALREIRIAAGGGFIYMQGAADRPIPYLRVVPNWVEQMKRAVDAADRSRAQ